MNSILKAGSPGRLLDLAGFATPKGKKTLAISAVTLGTILTIAGLWLYWFVYLKYLQDIPNVESSDPRRSAVLAFDTIAIVVSLLSIIKMTTSKAKKKNKALETFIATTVMILLGIRASYLMNPQPDPEDPRKDYSIVLTIVTISLQLFLLFVLLMSLFGVVIIPSHKLFK